MNKQNMLDAVSHYFRAFNEGKPKELIKLYAEEASLQDPYPGPLKKGIPVLSKYYENATGKGTQLIQNSPTRIAGNFAFVEFTVHVDGINKERNVTGVELPDGKVEIDVINSFEFNQSGEILATIAYWDAETNVRKL